VASIQGRTTGLWTSRRAGALRQSSDDRPGQKSVRDVLSRTRPSALTKLICNLIVNFIQKFIVDLITLVITLTITFVIRLLRRTPDFSS